VIQEYRDKGSEFLINAFNNPSYLEDLTGLTQMKQQTTDLDIEWEEDDFE
jgi:ubiquitin-like modifier-activating enzyme ATG7